MNSVNITGRFVADPEVKTTQAGTSVCSFTVAVDRRYTSKESEQKADFIDCVAWRQTAEFIGRYFTKGRMIAITGSLQTRLFDDKSGNRRKAVEVLVDRADFCDSKPTGSQEEWKVIEDEDVGELPF